ncbi:MAG: hypothetical protein HQK84_12750 [Nitrospinae bacterium]|nr:hypothetical protein [Nitrospinota bacterium]
MFTNILFEKHSKIALNKIIKSFQEDYSKKKGERFNIEGITYEIGNLSVKDKTLAFEISSKIPTDDEVALEKHDEYFNKVIKFVEKKGKVFTEARMEDISKAKDTEQKRDYVKLIYRIDTSTIIDEKDVEKRVTSGKVDVPYEEVEKFTIASSKIGTYFIYFFAQNAHTIFKEVV